MGGGTCGSCLGVVGLPNAPQVGPGMGKGGWDRSISSETGGNIPSSDGSAMTFPPASRGKSPGPNCLRDFPKLKRIRGQVLFRQTISKYVFKAGSFGAGTHVCVSMLNSVRRLQQANSWEATVVPMLIGNLRPPIL